MNRVSLVAAACSLLVFAGCGDDDGLSPIDAAVDGSADVSAIADGPVADVPASAGDAAVRDSGADGLVSDTAVVDGGIDGAADVGGDTSLTL